MGADPSQEARETEYMLSPVFVERMHERVLQLTLLAVGKFS